MIPWLAVALRRGGSTHESQLLNALTFQRADRPNVQSEDLTPICGLNHEGWKNVPRRRRNGAQVRGIDADVG